MKHFPLALLLGWILLIGTSCGSLLGREVSGQPYDEQSGCWGKRQPSGGIYRGPDGCTDDINILRAPSGRIWSFSNGCVPEDFEPVGGGLEVELFGAPQCGDLPL